MAVSLILAIKQNGQDIADNKTNVTVSLDIAWTYGSWNQENPAPPGWLKIDGTTYNFSSTFNPNKTSSGRQTLFTKTVDVTHDDDGSKTLECSASFDSRVSSGTVTAASSTPLTPIARASQPSLITWPETTNDVGNFGDTIAIHMNRNSDKFTHTVRYAFGSRTGTIATGVTTGTTWKIPEDFMDLIPESTSGSGLIYVDTYNGSKLVGTKYTGFTATVPASVKPSCTFTLEDVTTAGSIYGSPVKGLSKIKVVVTPKMAYSSPIADTTIEANGVKYNGSPITTAALTKSGTSRVTVTVKDKRGRTGTAYYDMTVLDYAAPSVTALTVLRCNQDGSANDRGEYIKVTFTADVYSMSGKNTASYKLRYKKTAASSYTSVAFSDIANNFAPTKSHIFAADTNSAYDVAVDATDRHSTGTRSTSASTAFTLINYHDSGTGACFGGVATKENTIQNNLDFIQTGNSYTFYSEGENGKAGFIRIAEITITDAYADSPIVFELINRSSNMPMVVNVLFKGVSTTRPGLQTIWYEGANYEAYLTETSASVWGLYVKKSSAYDNVTLASWHTSRDMSKHISVIFPGDLVATVPLGLNGYYRATPVIARSILDLVLPVGMIIQLYSHADPNTMYPGTTWVRMANTFLWGVDANGDIGTTGGSKTHQLTAAELPSHNHGGTYTNAGSATKTHAWLASGGSAMAYDTVNVGSGAAHNNMPPYTQVSIWRRTA